MLREVAGVSSAAALDYAGRVRVLEHLRRRGFKSSHSSAKASGMHVRPARDREPYLSKIEAILAVLGLPWSYVDAMAKKMFRVDRVRWLDPDQLHKLLVALIYHQKRKGAARDVR
jgi:phage gp16-like protein